MAMRVNKKFAILSTGTVVAVLFVLVGAKFAFSRSAASHVAAGDRLMEAKDYKGATERYRDAIGKDQSNPEVFVKLGDALFARVSEDSEYLGHARSAWNTALSADPNYVPALQRLSDTFWELVQLYGTNNDAWDALRDYATRLAAAQPDNDVARTRQHLATIQLWLNGKSARREDIEKSIKALTDLSRKHPDDPRIPVTIANVYLRWAAQELAQGLEAPASDNTRQALAVIDGALRGQEKNAELNLRVAQLYALMASMQKDDERTKQAYTDKSRAAVEAARKAAKPTDEVYPDVIAAVAERAARDGKTAEVDRLLKDLLKQRPNDQGVRLTAAKIWTAFNPDPTRREEAIALLRRPVATPAGGGSLRTLRHRDYQVATALELCNLLVTKAGATPNPAERDEVLKEFDGHYQNLQQLVRGEVSQVLRVKARRQQLQGDLDGAIETYGRALSTMQGRDFDLMHELARLYLQKGQTGNARHLLAPIAEKYKDHVPTRVLQAHVALQEGKLDEVKDLIATIEGLAPDSPQLLDLRVNYLKRAGDDAASDAFYKGLAEKTRPERMVKAQVANLFGKADEAVRLADVNVKADPKDLASVQLKLQALLNEKRLDEARRTLDAAIAANPDNTSLHDSRARLELMGSDTTPAVGYGVERDIISKRIKDPFRLALALGDVARRFNLLEEAEKQFKAAEKLMAANKGKNPQDDKAKNLAVSQRLFDLYANQRRFNEADAYSRVVLEAAGEQAPGILSQLSLAKGDAAAAVRHGQDLISRRPEFAESWVILGRAQQAAGAYAEARGRYETARQRQPSNFDAFRGLIECYYALRQPAEAGRIIEEGRETFSSNPLFREIDLSHEVAYGDPEKAIEPRESMLKQAPDDPAANLSLAAAYVNTARNKYNNEPAKKAALLAKGRDLMAKGVAKWPDDVRFHSVLADILATSGDAKGGEKVLKDYAAGEKRKDRPEPWVDLANYYGRNKQFDAQEAALRTAMDKSKGAPEVRARLVGALAQRGKFDAALKELEGQTDVFFVRQRIEVLLAAGRRDQAEKVMVEAVQRFPDVQALRTLLTSVYIDTGRFEQATALVNEALKQNPKDLLALHNRALIRIRQPKQDVDGAIQDLEKIRGIEPAYVPARQLLADIHLYRHDRNRATFELEQALQVAPLDAGLRAKLIDLYTTQGDWDGVLRLAADAEKTASLSKIAVWPRAASKAYVKKRNIPKALEAITRAMELTPPQQGAPVVREYLGLLIQTGKYQPLLEVTDRLIKTDGRREWWIYQHRGMARAMLKDQAGAVAEFDTAMSTAEKDSQGTAALIVMDTMAKVIGPDEAIKRATERAKKDVRWQVYAALLHHTKGDSARAVKMIDGVLAATKTGDLGVRIAALRTGATIYQAANPKEVDKARACFEELIRVQPKDFASLNNLAVLLAEDVNPPDFKLAQQYSQRAYDLVKQANPIESHVVDTHAWMLTLNGDPDAAIPMLRSVIDIDPFAEARYHLGEAYMRKNRVAEAVDQFKTALEEIEEAADRDSPLNERLRERIEAALSKAKAEAAAE